ncbi:MAG: methanogenesis marker 2 protein [Candidatus Methanomethylicota archaeon]|uniref:Methanogenesis marker 2 protein n=1 Tax=Thermoproteota archaeon TaxID=2056631 RepID=A0A497F1A1_9CREN|nr:MAG: methanogenesis marker 2 protein [Candidatus Verstraetearchaeota archaeon]
MDSYLKKLVEELKSFKGVVRKAPIGTVLKTLNHLDLDDAGFIELSDAHIVISTDGIAEDLIKADPKLAGYYSVLVNVNDVVAKGAKPIGYVNVISSPNKEHRRLIAEGIKEGLTKYRIKMLKGHTHPDTTYESIDAAIVGLAKTVVKSSTAKPGDTVVLLLDLKGKFGAKGWIKSYDATRWSSSEEVLSKINTVISIIESKLVTASRDISSPGIVGCLAMLCESSNVGALLNLDLIPRPEYVNLADWLTAYMSMGFIFTSKSPEHVAKLASKAGLTAKPVGKITEDLKITLEMSGEKQVFMDLSKESIFGLR